MRNARIIQDVGILSYKVMYVRLPASTAASRFKNIEGRNRWPDVHIGRMCRVPRYKNAEHRVVGYLSLRAWSTTSGVPINHQVPRHLIKVPQSPCGEVHHIHAHSRLPALNPSWSRHGSRFPCTSRVSLLNHAPSRPTEPHFSHRQTRYHLVANGFVYTAQN